MYHKNVIRGGSDPCLTWKSEYLNRAELNALVNASQQRIIS